MNRRKFLKYAGATAAVVGASALGLNYLAEQSPSITSQTSSTTLTPTLSTATVSSASSSESVQLASLQGRLFFDYNGNGVQDGEEPPVVGASVQLKDYVGNVVAESLTDSSGDYNLEDLKAGSYKLHVEADKKFRYKCRSTKEFTAVSEDYDVILDRSQSVDIGLMEGFLTLPFLTKKYSIGRFYDWDPSTSTFLWWNGRRGPESEQGGSINHDGTDFDIPEGQDIVASAFGVQFGNFGVPSSDLTVRLYHPSADLYTFYAHLSKITIGRGERVSRGQKIGESGSTGTTYPHLHFDVAKIASADHEAMLDPYHPVFPLDDKTSGYWVYAENNMQYWEKVDPLSYPNLLSGTFWTKNNDPQYTVT